MKQERSGCKAQEYSKQYDVVSEYSFVIWECYWIK